MVKKRLPVRERNRWARRENESAAHLLESESLVTLKEGLEIFITAKQSEGLRIRTIEDYRNFFRFFTEYLAQYFPQITLIQEITTNHIRDFISYMRTEWVHFKGLPGRDQNKKGLSETTINIRLRSLRAIFNFWYKEGYIIKNPMANIKLLRCDENDRLTGLTDDELKQLFSVFNDREFAEYRDKIMILLLLDTGLRVNELVNVKINHLDTKRMLLTVPAEISKLRKSRDIPISRKMMRKLLSLHEESKEYFGEHEHLFLTAYGEPMTVDAFRKRLWKYGKKAGLKRITPHMFRHTFSRQYILNGGDLFTLQRILDHSNITTTRKYVQMDEQHLRQQHAKYSPAIKYL